MATMRGERRIKQHPALGPFEEAAEITFRLDGETMTGREGDTIASALLAAGQRIFRTMPKTGEPRGGFCFVGRCVDCLVIVDGAPSVRACQTPLVAGVDVRTQSGLGDWNGETT